MPTSIPERIDLDLIADEILGYYDFCRARVMLPGGSRKSRITSTAFHEGLHEELFTTTAFGIWQFALIHLARHGPLDENLRRRLSGIFRLTLEHSLLVHEGATTDLQITYIANSSQKAARRHLKEKPRLYQEGFAAIRKNGRRLQFDDTRYEFVANALVRSLLNPPIGDFIVRSLAITPEEVGSFLEENSPNARLARLQRFLDDSGNVLAFRERLRQIAAGTPVIETHRQDPRAVPIEWILAQALAEQCFPVYLCERPRERLQALADAVGRLNREVQERGAGAIPGLGITYVDSLDALEDRFADTAFVPAPIPDDVRFLGFAAGPSATVTAAGMRNLCTAMHHGGRTALHLYLGMPERDGLPFTATDDGAGIVVCAAYSDPLRIRNTNHLVLHLNPDQMPEFLCEVGPPDTTVVVASIIDAIHPGFPGRPPWIAATLKSVMPTCKVVGSVPSATGLKKLIEYCNIQTMAGSPLRVSPYFQSDYDIAFVFVVHENPRFVALFPLSFYGWARFCKWANEAHGDNWMMTRPEAEDRIGTLQMRIATEHYCWMGF